MYDFWILWEPQREQRLQYRVFLLEVLQVVICYFGRDTLLNIP